VNVVCADSVLNLPRIQRAVRTVLHCMYVHAAQCRNTTGLIDKGVRLVAHDDLVSAPAVGQYGDKVAHGTAHDKEGCLFACRFCSKLLQPVDGWVLTIDVIAHLRLVHCFAHGLCGLRHRVTTQINRIHGHLLCCASHQDRMPASICVSPQ